MPAAEPLEPEVMAIHGPDGVAVHAQLPFVVDTAKVPVPPVLPIVADAGVTPTVQTFAACAMATTWFAMASVAVRGCAAALAATVKLSVPVPE